MRESAELKRSDFKIELIAVFAILVSLGFPGTLEWLYGEWLGTVMEYGAFFLEMFVMLFSGGKNWMDIRIINLEKRYAILYLFVTEVFIVSMMVTRYPSLQIVTCARLAVTVFFMIWLQERFRFMRLIELICAAQALFVVFTLYIMVRYPLLAYETGENFVDALRGLLTTKNTCAAELVFGCLVTAFLIHEKRKRWEGYRFWAVLWAVQLVLLFMCQATGPVFCLIAASFLFFVPSRVRMPMGWVYIVGSLVFLFATMTLMPAFEWFFDAIGKDATLTGRIPLWNQVIDVMLEHNTLTGFGYGMFWRDPEAYELVHAGFDENSYMGNMTSGAHNVLMEYWVNNGLIGLAVLFGLILYSMRRAEELPEAEYLFCSLIMAYLLTNGFTERCLGGNYDYKMAFFLLVLALCCRRADEAERNLKERNPVRTMETELRQHR